MEHEAHATTVSATRALGSFTTSAGLALGELLLLRGRPEDLLEHLRAIHIAARATIMSSDAGQLGALRRPGVSLAVAALGVVRLWYSEPQDVLALESAMALLEEVLEEMGVRYVEPDMRGG